MRPSKEKPPRGGKGLNSTESTEASQSGSGTSSSIVDELRNLLGNDVVLLPIKRGDKGPSGKEMEGWQSFTSAKMQEPAYLARLNDGANIGVLLGGWRATIDIDRDENVEPFLNLNPTLRETLRSRRKRGCNLWLRMKGAYPKSCPLKTRSGEEWGEWRADGNQTVIYGEAIDRKKGETEPTAYKIIKRAKPVGIAFDEIRWPPDLVLPWEKKPKSKPRTKAARKNNAGVEKQEKPDKEEVREMLAVLPKRPDYQPWYKIVAAVGDALSEADAIELLKEWSPEEEPGEYA